MQRNSSLEKTQNEKNKSGITQIAASRPWKRPFHSVQFNSVIQSCPTLCDPMNHSTPGLPVHHQLQESTQAHVDWVGDAIQPFHPLSSLLLLPSIFPASGPFQMSQLFTSGGQSIGVSASTSVPPMNTQGWSPLGWTGWISLQVQGTPKNLLQHQSSEASIL